MSAIKQNVKKIEGNKKLSEIKRNLFSKIKEKVFRCKMQCEDRKPLKDCKVENAEIQVNALARLRRELSERDD